MFGGDDDDFIGGMFDFDGDGKTSMGEAFIAHELFASDEELKLEYGESDDDEAFSLDDDDDDFDDTDDANDYSDKDDYENDSITVPIKLSIEFGNDDSQDAIQRSEYPNERTYKAADLLDSIERYPDIYGKTDYSKEIEKCRFILDNTNITAAKYLSYQNGFLFAQAVKERFKLPINIPDDDEDIHTSFSQLFRKLLRYNIEYAIRIWHWVLTMFSPYIKYGDDRDADELTSFVMCDIDEKQLITAAVYAETHPHFITVFLNTMPELPCMIENWICLCIQNNAKNSAKALFEGCLSSNKIECDAKEIFVSDVIENACNYDEIETIKFFRDVMFPVVIKYADKPMKRKMSEWQSDISEYIKENTEETEAECRKAYEEACETEQRKQKEQHDDEIDRRQTICRELENGENVNLYIYCAILLPSVPRPYHYRTTDESIKIGDKVIVPVGEENKEMTGTVASVEIHTDMTVPFPINKTKEIIRKA